MWLFLDLYYLGVAKLIETVCYVFCQTWEVSITLSAILSFSSPSSTSVIETLDFSYISTCPWGPVDFNFQFTFSLWFSLCNFYCFSIKFTDSFLHLLYLLLIPSIEFSFDSGYYIFKFQIIPLVLLYILYFFSLDFLSFYLFQGCTQLLNYFSGGSSKISVRWFYHFYHLGAGLHCYFLSLNFRPLLFFVWWVIFNWNLDVLSIIYWDSQSGVTGVPNKPSAYHNSRTRVVLWFPSHVSIAYCLIWPLLTSL